MAQKGTRWMSCNARQRSGKREGALSRRLCASSNDNITVGSDAGSWFFGSTNLCKASAAERTELATFEESECGAGDDGQ